MSSVSSPNSRVDASLDETHKEMILLEEFQKVNEVVVHRLEAEWKQTAIVSNLDLLLFSLFLRLCSLCRFCIALSFFGILLFKHGAILGFQCVKLLFDFISFLVDVALLSTAHSETTLPLMFRPIGDLTLLAAVRSLEASVATRIIIWERSVPEHRLLRAVRILTHFT